MFDRFQFPGAQEEEIFDQKSFWAKYSQFSLYFNISGITKK